MCYFCGEVKFRQNVEKGNPTWLNEINVLSLAAETSGNMESFN